MKSISQIHQEKEIPVSALCQGLSLPRATYYRHQSEKQDDQATSPPINSLTEEQRQKVLDLLHSERFVDLAPYPIYYTLLDEGEYHCSIRTMYRLLAEKGETKDRRNPSLPV